MPAVLLCDDNGDYLASLGHWLSLHGYVVTLAKGGYEALCQLRDKGFDLVLLDISMPTMDGIEVMKLANGHMPPVIIVTGMPERIPKPLPEPIRHVVCKPIEPEELLAYIQDVVGPGTADVEALK